jgi:hypothetical protein
MEKANRSGGCATRHPADADRAATRAPNMSNLDDGLYARDGNPISLEEFSALLARGLDYSRVAHTVLDDGVSVSTVWTGMDYNFFGEGPPLIFETMVFGGTLDGYQWRYPNEVAALAGHDQAVAEAMRRA